LRFIQYYTLLKQIAVFIAFQTGLTAYAYGQTPVANFTGSPLSGCQPLVVNFQNLSTGNPTSYLWDFGNGNTSSQQNPTAVYLNPGTYTVKLTVTNANGNNTLVRSQYITVYEPPTVNFSANHTAGCFPFTVQFTDQSIAGSGNSNTSWEWDFGNGQTSTLQNPTVIYTSAGMYTVTLKVTNDKGCFKVLSKPNYISVGTGPHAGFTHTQATVCRPPADISFTNTSTGTGPLTFAWDFGDGGTSTLQNPVHTYTNSGSFTARLVTTNAAGCTDTSYTSTPIVIGGIVTEFTGPDSICINVPAIFTNTSTPIPTSANWNFGDGGIASTIHASHAYLTAGTYTVKLFNTYANCTDSTTKTIVVNPNPLPDFTAPVISKCQPPLTVNFSDNSGGASSWFWDFGDGGTSTLQNPSHTYTSYGNFTVKLKTTNTFGCTDSIIKTNYIKIQRAAISIPSLPAHGCIPFTISPVATITALDNVTSYLWDFGDGNTSTNATPTHTYTLQGTYTVSLIITTSSGCTDTLTILQAVKAGTKPVADFSASPTTQCSYQPIQFTDLSVPADEWMWAFGDGGTSTQQNPSYSYALPGTWTVTLIATNSGCPDTISKPAFVNTLPPVARFNYAADCSNRTRFQFTDQSIGPVTWQWDFGDGSPLSNSQNPVHIFPALGTYNVTLTVTNGSCTHTVTHIVKAIDENPDFITNTQSGCKSLYVTMTAQNINTANIANYTWTFDGVNYFTTTNPSTFNFYNNSGTYTLGLITTDLNGCKDTLMKPDYVRVNGPKAIFSATNTAGCKGLTTTFNDLSTTDGVNAIVNWQWNFGDGTVQNFSGPPFQHTYNTAGTYSVKLIVTDAAGCKDSVTSNNLINASDPHALFTSSDAFACPGSNNIVFTNQSIASNFTSAWDFGDGNTSTLLSPQHTYMNIGLFTVKLVITDQYGCKDSITKNSYIRVDNPVAAFSISDSASSCTPFKVIFSNSSQYFNTLIWDFGDGGSSSLANPIYYYNSTGVFTAKLVVTSPGGCKDSVSKTITVYDTTGSRIDYTPFNGCKPMGVNLQAISPGTYTYLWDFGDGFSQSTSLNAVHHTYSTFGNFVPSVIMQDPTGCLIPLTGFDTIKVVGAVAKFGFDKNLLCDAGLITFLDSTTFNDPVVQYNWSFGDGGVSTLQSPSHQYVTPGNYSVQLAVQTQQGCKDTLLLNNVIKVVQSPVIDIGGNTMVCIYSPLIHTGVFLLPDTSTVSWQWTFPNSNTSAQQNPPAQTYSTSGTFPVTAIATNSSGCKDTATKNIVVYPLPTATLPATMTIQNGFPQTITATYSPNVLNWQWSPVQGLSCSNCPTPDADPKFKTIYTVTYTDNNGCQNSGSVTVFVLCKNANLFMPNTFSPNGDGSNDVFYPRGKGLDRVKSLRIFNRWGEVVFEKKDFPINNPAYGWDGSYKGKKPQADVYIFQVEVFCENGEIIKLDGNIALIL
jgi:gliding motility-associated-like protein